jgi:hypothetical protein
MCRSRTPAARGGPAFLCAHAAAAWRAHLAAPNLLQSLLPARWRAREDTRLAPQPSRRHDDGQGAAGRQ